MGRRRRLRERHGFSGHARAASTIVRRAVFQRGAPIGFLWLALPTRLKAEGVALEQITWLTSILVLPWTLKFVWAPLVDVLRSNRWSLRHWILATQAAMGLTLAPLLWLDPDVDFRWMTATLVVHAFCAATQDVAIDALCIAETKAYERGQYNGWMQAGMLLGRACLGGGALILATVVGPQAVILLLMGSVWFSSLMVFTCRERNHELGADRSRRDHLRRALAATIRSRSTWLGLAFGLIGGAAFKSLEVIFGPFLIDRGYSQAEIGWFSAGPMIVLMIAGSLLGGWLADKTGRKRLVAGALIWIVMVVSALALSDRWAGACRGPHLLTFLAGAAFGIGVFTASSYALFMDLTDPCAGSESIQRVHGLHQWMRVLVPPM